MNRPAVSRLALAVAILATLQAVTAAQDRPVRTVKDGLLDQIQLYVEKPPAATQVVIVPFTFDEKVADDNDDTKKMKVDGPPMLAERFIAKLKEFGPYTAVATAASAPTAADALVVDGKFTEMNPGSRTARYLVGFGAGKSGVTVEGSVKSGDGKLLAAFQQRRVGVMGVAGGNSLDKLTSDTRDIAEDIAKFLHAWATNKKLK